MSLSISRIASMRVLGPILSGFVVVEVVGSQEIVVVNTFGNEGRWAEVCGEF
jgi:hypothetical protein